MADKLAEHFLATVRSAFPAHAEFHVRRESDDICIYIDWKLGNDPARPNKRSKKIKVCISREAIEDYMAGREEDRKSADERLRMAVAANLSSFNPSHDTAAQVPVPIEEWTITTQVMNG